MNKRRDLSRALDRMRMYEGEVETNILVHNAVKEAADLDMRILARKLARQFPNMGETTALEVLAAIGIVWDDVAS